MILPTAEAARLSLRNKLLAAWEENEKSMAEMAAMAVACEQLGIEVDEGWELLAEFAEDHDET